MRPPPTTDIELEAAWTVAASMSGTPRRRDHRSGPNETHDFDIDLDDGTVVALEVTSSTVPDVVAMWDAINDLDWVRAELTENWSITLTAAQRGAAGAKVRRFHKEAPRWLAVLEQSHPNRIGDVMNSPGDDLTPPVAEAIARLRALGASGGGSVGQPGTGPAYIVIGTVGPTGPVDGSTVNEAVLRAIRDNLSKLLATTADEHHLFLWVDATDSPSSAAMSSFARPDAPELPEGVDCVWVALWLPNVSWQSNASTLWRLVPPGPWDILHLPAVRTYAEGRLGK